MTAPASTRTREPGQPVFVPAAPVPWDDLFLSPGQRWWWTLSEVLRTPSDFFARVALDRPGGAAWVPAVGALGTALVHGFIGSLLLVGGTTVSAPVAWLEIALGLWTLQLVALGLFGGTCFLLAAAFGARRLRTKSIFRLIAFAAAPTMLGVVPLLGPLAAAAGVLRALASALRVRVGLTRLEVGAVFGVGLAIFGLFPLVLLA